MLTLTIESYINEKLLIIFIVYIHNHTIYLIFRKFMLSQLCVQLTKTAAYNLSMYLNSWKSYNWKYLKMSGCSVKVEQEQYWKLAIFSTTFFSECLIVETGVIYKAPVYVCKCDSELVYLHV